MRIRRMILTPMLFIGLGFGLLWAESKIEEIPVSTARAWLSLVDGGNYSGSWSEASTFLRGAVTEKNWRASMEMFRKPLGKLIDRTIEKAEELSTLPGAPDGKYVVMTFRTQFTQKKSTIETITFVLDRDNKWRAAGYYIN